MTKTYVQQVFADLRSIGLGLTLGDMEFVRCQFRNCVLATNHDPAHRAILQNLLLKDSRVTSSSVSGAIIKDCIVEKLVSSRLEIIYGCAFEHVTLKGRIGRLWLRGLAPVLDPKAQIMDDRLVRAFDDANTTIYERIDWALDIREVVTSELQIDGIPAHLIRRDPERTVVFRRVAAVEGRWREHDLRKTPLRPFLDRLAQSSLDSQVFVIPDNDPERDRIIATVRELQAVGVAEAN